LKYHEYAHGDLVSPEQLRIKNDILVFRRIANYFN